MLGLIKKDLLTIKTVSKPLIIIIIALLALSIQTKTEDVIYMLPLIGVISFLSTFSYDQFNNWDAYTSTLPNGRKNQIKSKYLTSVIIIITLTILSVLFSLLISEINQKPINIDQIITQTLVILLTSTITISLLFPVMIKYGAQNGRLIVFIIVILLALLSTLTTKIKEINILNDIEKIIENHTHIIILLTSLIVLIISYLISKKIYQNKEF